MRISARANCQLIPSKCPNLSHIHVHVSFFSESCMALSVQKHLCIPIFYSCDSNNNLRANLIFATNLTHSITTIQMCDNGVWIATDQTPSNGRLKNINIFRGVPETFYTVCNLDGVCGTPPPPTVCGQG